MKRMQVFSLTTTTTEQMTTMETKKTTTARTTTILLSVHQYQRCSGTADVLRPRFSIAPVQGVAVRVKALPPVLRNLPVPLPASLATMLTCTALLGIAKRRTLSTVSMVSILLLLLLRVWAG